MNSATNIDDLPTVENNLSSSAPVQPVNMVVPNVNSSNVNMSNDAIPGPGPTNATVQLSADDVNKIITGIQQASQSNLTALPMRDVPTQQTTFTMDEETANPNYIPNKQKEDYIQNTSNYNSMVREQYEAQQKQNSQDELFDMLQIPFIISVLYFLFQLPVFRKYMFQYLPGLFLKDGNISFNGIVFKSLLFGFSYYVFTQGVAYMSVV